jgi:rod shape-determining protein MreC
MGNIFAFLLRHHRFFIFIILEAICLSLVVNFNSNQGSSFYQATTEISGNLYKRFHDVRAYFHLQNVKDSLMHENAILRSKLNNAYYFDTAKTKQVNDTTIKQHYVLTPCNVINNFYTDQKNYILLDAGSRTDVNNYLTLGSGTNRGIGKHLGVVTTSGIAGVTREVSPHFTSVLSVLHKDFSVSAEISELKEIGKVVWDGGSSEIMILKDIPLHIRIKKGMHVVTSPYSEIFPQGTPIGVIDHFEIKQAEAFYTIYIRLASDMRNLRTVYIVNNLMKDEQEKVESLPEKTK